MVNQYWINYYQQCIEKCDDRASRGIAPQHHVELAKYYQQKLDEELRKQS